MNYVEQIKAEQAQGRTGKGRFASCSGWLAKRRCVRFKAIWRLLRVWARGVGAGGGSRLLGGDAGRGLIDLEQKGT